MFLTVGLLLLAIGGGAARSWQRLTCPFRAEHDGLPRVWCKQLTSDCCGGFVFPQGAREVDGAGLKVTAHPGSPAVTVEAPQLVLRAGVYWCGVLGANGTVIKLAEGFIHGSFVSYTWNILRWTALPLLPVFSVFYCIYSRAVKNIIREKRNHLYQVAVANKVDPECEDKTAPPVELD